MDPSLTPILRPMTALVLLTFIVSLVLPYHRVKAGLQRRVVLDDFKYGESENVPDHVRIPNRNLMNLLEMPLLFYVACITLYVTKSVDPVDVNLAWLYVGLRTAHSIVHLGYNKLLHRIAMYALSNAVLGVIWVRLGLSLF